MRIQKEMHDIDAVSLAQEARGSSNEYNVTRVKNVNQGQKLEKAGTNSMHRCKRSSCPHIVNITLPRCKEVYKQRST